MVSFEKRRALRARQTLFFLFCFLLRNENSGLVWIEIENRYVARNPIGLVRSTAVTALGSFEV